MCSIRLHSHYPMLSKFKMLRTNLHLIPEFILSLLEDGEYTALININDIIIQNSLKMILTRKLNTSYFFLKCYICIVLLVTLIVLFHRL